MLGEPLPPNQIGPRNNLFLPASSPPPIFTFARRQDFCQEVEKVGVKWFLFPLYARVRTRTGRTKLGALIYSYKTYTEQSRRTNAITENNPFFREKTPGNRIFGNFASSRRRGERNKACHGGDLDARMHSFYLAPPPERTKPSWPRVPRSRSMPREQT